MAKPNEVVIVKLHKDFFNNIFEPERRNLQQRFGKVNLSQREFTEYLARSGAKISYPIKSLENKMHIRKSKYNFKLGLL